MLMYLFLNPKLAKKLLERFCKKLQKNNHLGLAELEIQVFFLSTILAIQILMFIVFKPDCLGSNLKITLQLTFLTMDNSYTTVQGLRLGKFKKEGDVSNLISIEHCIDSTT